MYKAFIEPDLETAHIKITNKFNPFTGFQNPTYILKVACASLLLSGLDIDNFEYCAESERFIFIVVNKDCDRRANQSRYF